jgi:hypothetical protein
MSGLILPALAIGGVYLIYDHMTKKNKNGSSSNSASKSRSIRNSTPKSKSKKSASLSMDAIKVRRNKTKKNKEEKKRPLYVYYSHGSIKGKKWSYNSLPSGWSVKKKTSVSKKDGKYSKMVSFSGPNKNRESMKKYLTDAFNYLSKKNIVKNYKITSESI